MKIYRVAYYGQEESSIGFSFHSRKKEAVDALKYFLKTNADSDERTGLDVYDVKPTKKDFINLLNQVASEPQNG